MLWRSGELHLLAPWRSCYWSGCVKPSMHLDMRLHCILPACTTATAHTFAFEFDLVMDRMAIFNNKQAEVSIGGKTCDTTVYNVWKHVAWSKHAVKSWLYVEHPDGLMLFAWHFFNHRSNKDKQLSHITMWWLLKPQQKNQFTQRVNTQYYFVSPIGIHRLNHV